MAVVLAVSLPALAIGRVASADANLRGALMPQPALAPVPLARVLVALEAGAQATGSAAIRDGGEDGEANAADMTAAEEGRTSTPSQDEESTAAGDAVLPDVDVTGRREVMQIDPTQSRTTIDSTEMARRGNDNVYELLQDTAGVSIDGGPLANGYSFNIRGFNNSEDVLITLDGAQRNFEKYRFGTGVFVEPELLKQVEVTRGPAGTLQGSGAIGGAVAMETKDGRDLVRVGRKGGATAKMGIGTNNKEQLSSLSAYAMPLTWFDLLANITRRDSDNIVTASGEELENSSNEHFSRLLKGGIGERENARLELANVFYEDEGLEPFDATFGQPGVFGFVRRRIEDGTTTANLRYTPEQRALRPFIDVRGSLGYTDTLVADTGTDTSTLPEDTTNMFEYDIVTAQLTNSNAVSFGSVRNMVTYGVQANRNRRDSTTVRPSGVSENLTQPSGEKRYIAWLLEEQLEIAGPIGELVVTGGVRRDYYQVEVTVDQSRQALLDEGRGPTIEFERTSPSAGVALTPLGGPLSVFYNYAEAFRPPLLDEYFTQGAFSRCNFFFLGTLAPASGICGDLYVPETSVNHEIGVSVEVSGLFAAEDLLRAKALYFVNETENTLQSITAVTPTAVGQPGRELRQGLEVELGYQTTHWFTAVALSTVRGLDDCQGKRDLVDLPGDTLVFSLGRNDFDGRLEYGYRLRAVDDRIAVSGGAPIQITACNIGQETTVADGYVLHNLFLSYAPWQNVNLNLSVENFTNTRYFLSNSLGGIGQEAPGYDVRFSFSVDI